MATSRRGVCVCRPGEASARTPPGALQGLGPSGVGDLQKVAHRCPSTSWKILQSPVRKDSVSAGLGIKSESAVAVEPS